jgi:hypothetical protein
VLPGAATRPDPRVLAAAAAGAAGAAAAGPPAVSPAAGTAAVAGGAAAENASPARSPRRSLALAALAAAVLGVVLVATALPGGSERSRQTAQVRHPAAPRVRPTATTARRAAAARPKPKAKAKPAPARAAAPVPASRATTTTATATPEVTGTAAAATTPVAAAGSLEADGHALVTSGNYQAAIPILRQAADTAPRGSLTYAYALYDLGRALRLAGDPRAAAGVLYRRLQIHTQTSTVRGELQAALLQMGKKAGAASSAKPAPHRRGPSGHRPPGHSG